MLLATPAARAVVATSMWRPASPPGALVTRVLWPKPRLLHRRVPVTPVAHLQPLVMAIWRLHLRTARSRSPAVGSARHPVAMWRLRPLRSKRPIPAALSSCPQAPPQETEAVAWCCHRAMRPRGFQVRWLSPRALAPLRVVVFSWPLVRLHPVPVARLFLLQATARVSAATLPCHLAAPPTEWAVACNWAVVQARRVVADPSASHLLMRRALVLSL